MRPFLLPGCLEATTYVLWSERADATWLRRVLEVASPHARCLEVTSDARDIPPRASVVFTAADLPHATATLAERGARGLFLPVPETYPWAWYDFMRALEAALGTLRRPRPEDLPPVGCQIPYVRAAFARARPCELDGQACYLGPDRKQVLRHTLELQVVMRRLESEPSRDALRVVLGGSPQALWRYFSARVFREMDYLTHTPLGVGDVVLNVGVFSGHELPYFLACLGGRGRVLDVDPLGHDLLSPYAAAAVRAFGHIVSEHRIAAVDDARAVAFDAYLDGQLCEARDGQGTASAAGLPLDDLVDAERLDRVDLIKIDIEGGERAALAGAWRTIIRFRPTIVVAIYHAPDDYWQIPLQLMQRLTGYAFFVNHYSFVRWETLLYCVPRERIADLPPRV